MRITVEIEFECDYCYNYYTYDEELSSTETRNITLDLVIFNAKSNAKNEGWRVTSHSCECPKQHDTD